VYFGGGYADRYYCFSRDLCINVRDRFGQNTLKTLESTMCIQCLQHHIFSVMIQVVRVAFSIFV